MKSAWVDIGGPVHYLDHGGVGSPLVLVHGHGGSSANWCSVAPELARHHRVYALDLRGFGQTPLGDHRADLKSQRDLIIGFVEKVAGPGTGLIGNSLGGLLSILVAGAAPSLINSLVLVCPAMPRPLHRASIDLTVLGAYLAFSIPGLGERYLHHRAHQGGPEKTVRTTLELCCVDAGRIDPAAVASHVELARARLDMPWAARAFLQASRSMVALLARPHRYHLECALVECPVLVVQGEKDRLAPLVAAQALVHAHPTWQLEVMGGVGHIPMLEAPDQFVEIVSAWLAAERFAQV